MPQDALFDGTAPEDEAGLTEACARQALVRFEQAVGPTHVLGTETPEDRLKRSAPSFRNMRRFGFEAASLCSNYLLRLPRGCNMKSS